VFSGRRSSAGWIRSSARRRQHHSSGCWDSAVGRHDSALGSTSRDRAVLRAIIILMISRMRLFGTRTSSGQIHGRSPPSSPPSTSAPPMRRTPPSFRPRPGRNFGHFPAHRWSASRRWFSPITGSHLDPESAALPSRASGSHPVGFTGRSSICHDAFFLFGAFTSAYISQHSARSRVYLLHSARSVITALGPG